tara:strand:+ start:310 stop:441 length:132 start_codon:yes stop_codon:yes gene_type:complete
MPFKSEKQRRYLWANEPTVARKFADEEKRRKYRSEAAKKKKKK